MKSATPKIFADTATKKVHIHTEEAHYRWANLNMAWCSVALDTLAHLGVDQVVLSPGSRSAPFDISAGLQNKLNPIVILDERSAAFFAIGHARRTHKPTVMITTSGTAAANCYPALIEAHYSNIPFILITADRPPELQECQSPQTIDQLKLFGTYPRWQTSLPLPENNLRLFETLRQNMLHAFERALFPHPGPVHLNFPLRDPLAPIADTSIESLLPHITGSDFYSQLNFFPPHPTSLQLNNNTTHLTEFFSKKKGLILVGLHQPEDTETFTQSILSLSQKLNWPILTDSLNPLRHHSETHGHIISTYDAILRNPSHAHNLAPEAVLSIGSLPTSKVTRTWLEKNPYPTAILHPYPQNIDPLHRNAFYIRTSLEGLTQAVQSNLKLKHNTDTTWFKSWKDLDTLAIDRIEKKMERTSEPFEGKLHWLLADTLPALTQVYIATSTPIRDSEFFTLPNNKQYNFFASRGTNGIDGTISIPFGIAHRASHPTVLVIGDLSFLHDNNGLLAAQNFQGSLTILLIDNHGGGIFEHLPVSQFGQIYERVIATPQAVDASKIAQAHNIPFTTITHWDDLIPHLSTLPTSGIRIFQINTHRKTDAITRGEIMTQAGL
jgi:2-succinyl-5-enolpyruvyl-6-hydroxy-3-cyclohexene-1-carboxylate synthase